MTLLRIDASILGPRSASSELADLVLAAWSAERPGEAVVSRHLGAEPLPADAWATAVGAGYTPEDQRSDAQRSAVALAAGLTAELRAADHVVIAAPLYNFGVSQHLKIWLDLAIAGGAKGEKLLDGKPVVLVTTRGGAYGAGTPREGWDHSTDFLRRILADVWGAELTVVEREFTLVGVNPALDAFTETAALMKKEAHEQATAAGSALAGR
ncbi:FMN-dependent NADH-azoreductase [Amorphoplanes digitatis]|uniref:FMN dependent NADH:quinone oxidoreductase n=1 Tax=Actinoplanes digitatis TaxID=1868 RepID=A0A7W7HVG6_9ACTN|nr:NAD(P)H-dependent oxidoreductase [Actinoplanes digitatis]MBB4761544.1 FMN-dependent NADH-azoreductase [Actinoplanes digitatis]BFE70081.1 NAD(P)H-dependent oxidoreductase [Actinoplanes digitatis]GID90652.1 FMN-dependent NADH-azoreductase [Actinoplanes digitatis]